MRKVRFQTAPGLFLTKRAYLFNGSGNPSFLSITGVWMQWQRPFFQIWLSLLGPASSSRLGSVQACSRTLSQVRASLGCRDFWFQNKLTPSLIGWTWKTHVCDMLLKPSSLTPRKCDRSENAQAFIHSIAISVLKLNWLISIRLDSNWK